MSSTKNNQWRKTESVAIQRAKRIAKNLERIMFVIYDNDEEHYDIVSEEQLDNLTTVPDVDFDFIAEVA
jgi:protein-arginine kinase